MTTGKRAEKERRRRLAVQRVLEGYSQQEVAKFLGVAKSTVSGWMKAHRERGDAGLAAGTGGGRPRKLSPEQEAEVLTWFNRPATDFGFPTELWTAPRVAQLIERKWQIQFHERYLNQWLAERRITPQKPRRVPRERDDNKIRHWLRYQWPRVKNGRKSAARASY